MRSVPSVTLPAELVQEPGNLPSHCARHGRSATRRADFTLRVKGGRVLGGAFTAASRANDVDRVRVLPVTGWPLCPSCVRSRTVWLTLTIVLFSGGMAAFFGSLAVQIAVDNPPVHALALIAMLGFIAMVVAWLPSYLSGYPRLANASPSPDGRSVVVLSPSDEFRADLTGEHRV